MTQSTLTPVRGAAALPMPANITSIQPGGGWVMRLELAWGRLRRRFLRRFRKGYVRRMLMLRRGDCPHCPHDIIDPRDLKFFRNVCGYDFDQADDPFRWRGRLPFARDALAELVLFSLVFLVAAAAVALTPWRALAPFVLLGIVPISWFFRDPKRTIRSDPCVVLSPADGTVMDIEDVEQAAFIGGPAVKIGIFLSLLNVHVNRAPLAARVVSLSYRPGRFFGAMRQRAVAENERMEIRLQQHDAPHRRFMVRQISGAVARRIVCALRPEQRVAQGERFGLIKLGSRTEIVLPKEDCLTLSVDVGARVRAGITALARYSAEEQPS